MPIFVSSLSWFPFREVPLSHKKLSNNFYFINTKYISTYIEILP